ncbi:cyclase/dehydrase [Neolentinus lepideus HHB14362 ss-1]|uniref:Cyclase/dehydrase n=1 Tax=Neolentinus lepideus HHB14362 ss-1 TaxID=1314782 RepID=A0A165S1K4_9AGAM|nr:cyclase/dehydrase [Neolentinus lepideus HHB14362 ss-1]
MPSFSPFSGNNPKPQTYHERKILPYTRPQLYEVVADVASYPRFVPFCTGSRILTPPTSQGASPSVKQLEAELTVGFLSFKESYVSKVVCTPYESVEATALSSSPLFKTLVTTWRFQDVVPQSTRSNTANVTSRDQEGMTMRSAELFSGTLKNPQETVVTLDLAYAFANPLHASASAMFFGQVSRLMVDAFQRRCTEVYG